MIPRMAERIISAHRPCARWPKPQASATIPAAGRGGMALVTIDLPNSKRRRLNWGWFARWMAVAVVWAAGTAWTGTHWHRSPEWRWLAVAFNAAISLNFAVAAVAALVKGRRG